MYIKVTKQKQRREKIKFKYYLRYFKWFVREFSYRFWMGRKKSNSPNMTKTEYDTWFPTNKN